jgi:eukaryotic-like serine/threonine-protein kinase
MSFLDRIKTLFRLFLLFTVLVAVAVLSAITTIRFSIHGHQETMPNLVGKPFESALRTTNGLGLVLKVEDKIFNTQYPANTIVSQMPPPGIRIKMGQHAHVLVSLGAPKVDVPNLVGSSIRAAKIAAIQRGLTLGDVAMIHWSGAEADQVVAQDPPPSSAGVHSPAVNLLVSAGDTPEAFLCPNFVGQQVTDVRRTLEKSSFKLGQVTSIATDAAKDGTILTQTPPPGSKIGLDAVFGFQVAKKTS